jgi:hypothetical protein
MTIQMMVFMIVTTMRMIRMTKLLINDNKESNDNNNDNYTDNDNKNGIPNAMICKL